MNIITVRYWGRTGNVLFQIGAAVAYANKYNRPFLLNKYDSLPNLDNHTPTSIGLDESEFERSLKEHSEDDIKNGTLFPENTNVKLTGFFQDYYLFDRYKEQILDIVGMDAIRKSAMRITQIPAFKSRGLFTDFDPSSTPLKILNLHRCKSPEITISLHIRRGDYEQLRCYFLLLNEYYYKRALLHIITRTNNHSQIKFNVLCFYEKNSAISAKKVIDALKMDTDLSTFQIEYHFFNEILEETSAKVNDIEEMTIISQCKHHIISNSTYSWWASYMYYDPSMIVCYPDEYFNHNLFYLSNAGLKVEGWTSISAWNPTECRCECR